MELQAWEADLLASGTPEFDDTKALSVRFDEEIIGYADGDYAQHRRIIGKNLYRFIRWTPEERYSEIEPPYIVVQRWSAGSWESYQGGYWRTVHYFDERAV